tara:strand:- start:37654 stop:37884 length:231 start_codon:yes stop_codon:yes gene_type:complete
VTIYIVPVELTAKIQVVAESIEEAVEMVESKSKYETIHLMAGKGDFNVGHGLIIKAAYDDNGELTEVKESDDEVEA